MNVKEESNNHGKDLVSSPFLGKGEAPWEQESINSESVGKIS